MKYLCIYDEYVTQGTSLIQAWDNMRAACNVDRIEDCIFYEVDEPLEVEIKIIKKEVVKTINKVVKT